MSLEIVSIEHIPPSFKVFLAAYRDVQNAAFLQQQLLDRNPEFEYAFVDASVVVSRRQLLSAIFKSIIAASSDHLRTSNVHSEIVVSLNASNNISESYKRFGISPSTRNLVVIKVTHSSGTTSSCSQEAIQDHLTSVINGHPFDVTDTNFVAITDYVKLRKYYKLNRLDWLDSMEDEKTMQSEVDSLIISSIALRGV